MTRPALPDRLQVVVFDLDDTLYPERDYVRSGYAAVGEWLRQRRRSQEAYEDWLWRRFQTGRAAGAFDALSEQFGLGLTGSEIAELVGVYREHTPMLRPRAGAVDMLNELARHYRLGLLSDGFLPAQRLKLRALGLETRFQHVLFTEKLGRECWKPSPAGFRRLQEQFGTLPEAMAYVGDNPAKDFLAGNELGWSTVQVRFADVVHAYRPSPPDGDAQYVVDSLAELKALLLSADPPAAAS